ncbi:CHAP domain-containing protein [Corynebacterium durum]|uniref:CHAP domain-containing protein n=2 Tax=Corynebacterium durum TaxID=61592 RepID=UPI0028E8B157|nr:CHAP domain-containing protein [Corynebacterium durum]
MNTKRSLKRVVPSAVIAILATGFALSPQAIAQSSLSSDLGSLSSDGSSSSHQTDKTKAGQDSQSSVTGKNVLKQNETLRVGQSLRSENGKFEARMQEDGNLVIQKENKTVTWSTSVKKTGNSKELIMQQDGNLVLYVDRQVAWASHTESSNANCLTLTNEGALQVKKDESVVWDSSKSGDKADTKKDDKKDDKAPSQDAKKDDKSKDAQKTDAPKKDDKPKADAPKDDKPKADPPKNDQPKPEANPAEGKFKEFTDQTMGKPICNHGACECVALFNHYNEQILGHGFISVGAAKDLHAAAPDANWEKLPASATPRKGDVAIWGHTWQYSPYGHVAVVESDAGDHLNVISQNPGATRQMPLPKTSLVGYLRPKL